MSPYQISLIVMACTSVVTVCGVFMITGLCGIFSLGQAAYMSICAYVTFVLAKLWDVPLLVTALLGLALCAIVSLLISFPILKLRVDYFALLSVAFNSMVLSVVLLLSEYTNGSIGYSKIPKVKPLLWLALGIAILIVFMVRNFKYSRFGRMCIALKTDPIAARSFGIDVQRLKMSVYVIASVIAGIGGILYGLRNRVITPDAFGWSASAEMEIFLFFGGTNSLTGAVISSVLLKLAPQWLRGVTIFGQSLQEYRTFLYCALIILVLNFRPKGLLGEKELNPLQLKQLLRRRRKEDK